MNRTQSHSVTELYSWRIGASARHRVISNCEREAVRIKYLIFNLYIIIIIYKYIIE